MEASITTKQSEKTPTPTQAPDIGEKMYDLIENLFPLCRSITGAGTLETLKRLRKIIPLTIYKIPTGTPVFDWEIAKEWNIRDAWVKNSEGEKIIDFRKSNLHIVNYSVPIQARMSLKELKNHLYSIPEHPDWIPYRTSYYQENWGFCISHNQLTSLTEDVYEVCIDASLEPGHLAYGELLLKGESPEEVLISTHICHPSLCNDNLSGISVVSFLARYLLTQKRRYTYRFLFMPATIGAIAWLSLNELKTTYIRHGLVAALLGDSGPFTYRKSRKGNAEIDKVVQYVLQHNNSNNQIRDFDPYGSDQRQFCSPGFDLPVGCLTRTPFGEYPEYHTSADNLELMDPSSLKASLDTYIAIIKVLEHNHRYINVVSKCEPQLGKYGLYDKIGGDNNAKELQIAMLWVLNLSDGDHTLLDIALRSSIEFETIAAAAATLSKARLLKEKTPMKEDSGGV